MITTLPEGKPVIGVREVKKAVKKGDVGTVVLSSNAPAAMRKDLEELAKKSGIKLETFSGDSERLGTTLGKPFLIAAVGYKGRGSS